MSAARPLTHRINFLGISTKRTHQKELEELYDKNQLMPRVRQAFRDFKRLDFAKAIREANLPEKFGFDLLANMAVHKRATVPTLVGCLRHHFEGNDQATANALELALAARLVDYSSRNQVFIVLYGILQKLQEELDRFQYPLPMVVRPEPLEDNLDTGYLTQRSSVILRDNHHEDDVCLDHLNRINRTRFSLNLDVAKTIQNRWKRLDRKKADETWEDWQKRRKAFEKYDAVAKDIIALLLKEGNEIYLTHRYDFRGRTYCMGFHITYQGTDWNKAVLELADKEVLRD